LDQKAFFRLQGHSAGQRSLRVARTDRIYLAASLGGHLELLSALGSELKGRERTWVTAAGSGADRLRGSGDEVRDLPRFSRASPLSAVRNVLGSFLLALRERPRLVLTTGAGSIVAFCVAARLLGAKVVFVETMARVTSPSASGRVLSRIAAKVVVQWPEMARVYRGAIVCRPALWEDVASGRDRDGGGTFVSVGTHRHAFDRLLAMVDRAAGAGLLPGPVTAQTGSSTYSAKHFESRTMLSQEEVAEALEVARYVVCHAGSGIISAALRAGHMPLVLGRRRDLHEHVDDHQEQIVGKLSELGLVVPLDGEITEADLAAATRGVVRQPALLAGGLSLSEVLERELEELAPAAAVHAAPAARNA
jgi:UDP-N-acetylglucosamine--N-acetylmuramyl-(pentapeptide) pyrophosphoryl-undecaprenol N-acetylglucosamine transferase